MKKTKNELDKCVKGEAEALRVARLMDNLPYRSNDWEPLARGDNGMTPTRRIEGVVELLRAQRPIGWLTLTEKVLDACEKDCDTLDMTGNVIRGVHARAGIVSPEEIRPSRAKPAKRAASVGRPARRAAPTERKPVISYDTDGVLMRDGVRSARPRLGEPDFKVTAAEMRAIAAAQHNHNR